MKHFAKESNDLAQLFKWKVFSSNLDLDTTILTRNLVFRSSFRRMPRCCLNEATINSSHILSESLFIQQVYSCALDM
jgi:hypothetical protein